MSAKETGKSRSQRIQLDYHRARGALYWTRWIATLSALVVAGAYAGFTILHPKGRRQVSTGPVATAHASFENDCQKCHGDTWGQPLASDAFKWNLDSVNQLETACQHCHKVESHFRSHLVDQQLDRNCALCHRDHQGRDFVMTSVASEQCTQCHDDLSQVMLATAKPQVSLTVSDFSMASHSIVTSSGAMTFRSLNQDSGRIKFDHAQHLAPGQVNPESRGGFRMDMLPAHLQQQYKASSDHPELVQLACNDCHEIQGTSRASINSFDAENGRYFGAVNFDKHCSACHGLNFAGQTEDQLPLPHAAPWNEVKTLLAAKTVGGRVTGTVRMPSDPLAGPLPPGKAVPEVAAKDPQMNQVELEAAVQSVRQTCVKCHEESDLDDAAIARQFTDQRIEMIPTRWLRYGLFDHAAHRNITQCQYCHPVPGVNSLQASNAPPTDHQSVMIAGPEACVDCHRDANAATPEKFDSLQKIEQLFGNPHQPTWASAKCTECHRYHWTRPDNHLAPLTSSAKASSDSSSRESFP